MAYDDISTDLVCAHCAGRVAEGRCATCRAAREELRPDGSPYLWLAVVAALLLVALVVLRQV